MIKNSFIQRFQHYYLNILFVALGVIGAVFASNMMFEANLFYPITGWQLWFDYPMALGLFLFSISLMVINFYLLHTLEKREFERLSDDSKKKVRKLESRLRIPVLILAFLIFLNQFFMEGTGKTLLQVITVIMILILLFLEYRRRKFIKEAV